MLAASESTLLRTSVYYPAAMITGGSTSIAFFFFVGVGLGFFGVSGAVATGVAAGVSLDGTSPSPIIMILNLVCPFFFAVLADGFVFNTWPKGPTFVCTGAGGSSGISIECNDDDGGSGTEGGGGGWKGTTRKVPVMCEP